MFGMSWGEIAIILAVGMFVLGPERIPVAVKWVGSTLKTVRTMAAGAQEQLRGEFGPELDELRRQIADLQSLKEIQELRSLRDLNPRSMITKNILGEEFSGGVKGMLGLDGFSDIMKPTGSGVAPEAPGVDVTKPVPFEPTVNEPAASPPAADEPVFRPAVNELVADEPFVNEPAVVLPVVNEPPVAQAAAVEAASDQPAQTFPDLTKVAAAPRHAAPSSFDPDAT